MLFQPQPKLADKFPMELAFIIQLVEQKRKLSRDTGLKFKQSLQKLSSLGIFFRFFLFF